MRADMAKVITERPRVGGHGHKKQRDKKKILLRKNPDLLPFRESCARGRKGDPKSLTDLLGPLWRFLRSRVGRPWDKVYSELRERIHPHSQVQLHVLDHVRWYVERHVKLIRKTPFRSDGTRLHADFYVHPVTGLLSIGPGYRYRYRRPPLELPTYVELEPGRELHIIDGVWYEIRTERIPEHVMVGRGLLLEKYLDRYGLGRRGGFEDLSKRLRGHSFIVSKRQLGKKEKKALLPRAVEAGLVPRPGAGDGRGPRPRNV